MPLVPLTIPPGVVKPATPLLAKGRYWDANLIRWRSNKLLPVGGWQRITSTPLASTVRALFPFMANDGASLLMIGCESKLYVGEGATYVDITPTNFVSAETGAVGGYGAYNYGALLYGDDTDATYPRPLSQLSVPSFTWTMDNWGEDILSVASSDGRLFYYGPGNTQASVVGYSLIQTINRTSNVVTVTTTLDHTFRTGQTVTIAGVTNTSFNGTFTVTSTPTLTTFTYAQSMSNATSSGGDVTHAGTPINNRGVIVTPERHAVLFGMDGNSRRVGWSDAEDFAEWDFASATNTAGFFDLDTQSRIIMATSVREGTLIWTEDEAWLMRYIGLPYIYGFERIGFGCGLLAPRSFATFGGRCVWMGRENFWIYDGGYVKPLPCDVNEYIVNNMDPTSGKLYTHGAENGLFPEAWFWYPSNGSSVPDQYVIYNYAEGWWSIGSMTRTAASGASVFSYPTAADQNNDLFYHENGWTNNGASLVGDRWVESGSLNLQQGNNVMMVKQALTDSGYGYDSTALQFYTSYTPEGTETLSSVFSPKSNGYTDVRVSGREMRIRLESTQDAPWSIGETRLDLVPRGGR
jgi:hypothetical protein